MHRTTYLTTALTLVLTAGCGGHRGSSTSAATAAPANGASAPQATVAAVRGAAGTVLIDYALTDAQGDPASVAVRFSIDRGATWSPATRDVAQGDATQGLLTSSTGFGYVFAWDTVADLGRGTALCRLQLTPSDASGIGGSATSVDFVVDNTGSTSGGSTSGGSTSGGSTSGGSTSSVAPQITLLSPDRGARTSTVRIYGVDFDPQVSGNVVTFAGIPATVWFASTTQLVASVPANAPVGSVPVNVVSNGVSALAPAYFEVYPDAVLTAVSPTAAAIGATITLTGDHFDTRSNGVIVRFTGGAQVTATASSPTQVQVTVPAAAMSGEVWLVTYGVTTNRVPFAVQTSAPAPSSAADDHGDDAATATPVALGATTGGVIETAGDRDWFAVDLQAGQSYRFETTVAGAMDTVLYLVAPDGVTMLAQNDDLGSSTLASRIDATAATSGRHFAYVRHYDRAATGAYTLTVTGASSTSTPSTGTSSTNVAPTISVGTSFSSVQTGDVRVAYTVTDANGDRVDVRVEYSLAFGAWYPATAAASSDPVTGISASAGGTSYVFAWNSVADIGAIGTFVCQLRFVASDASASSPTALSSHFYVDNSSLAGSTGSTSGSTSSGSSTSTSTTNTAPTVLSVGTPSSPQRGLATIPYTVADDQSDPVTIEVHYMLDAISGWQPATMAVSSDPVTGVATSPTGRSYAFVWDALVDLGLVTKTAIVRVRATDGSFTSTGRVTGSFQVDNR